MSGLPKDTISINLAKGMNTKTDDKIAGPDQMGIVTDGRFTQDKRIVKRNGLTAQGTSFQGDPGFITPVTIAASGFKTKSFAHENQLCEINNGSLFSQYEGQNKWVFKGTLPTLGITNSKVDSTVTFRDVATVGGITITVGGQSIYVIEEATGNVLTKTTLSGSETTLKIAAFTSAAWVFTYGSGSNNLLARQVNLTNGSVGSPSTIKTDFNGAVASGSRTLTAFSIARTSTASTIGENVFVAYLSSTSGGDVIFPFSPSGTIHSLGSGTLATSASASTPFSIYIEPTSNPNKIYFANSSVIKAFTFGTSSYSTTYGTNYTPSSTPYTLVDGTSAANSVYNNVAMALSPVDNSTLYVFIDTLGIDPVNVGLGNSTISDDDIVDLISVTSGGTIASNVIYGRGYRIAAQAIRDTGRKTIYLPVTYISPLQSTVLLVDILEGNANVLTYVVGKTLYGFATSPTSGYLPESSQVGTASLYRATNNGYFIDFNLSPTYAASSQFFAKTTHVAGGMLWAYDGITLAEHNFLIGPENVSVSNYSSTQAIVVNITQQGSPGVRETTQVTFAGGQAFNGAGSPTLTFTSITGTTRINYLVRFPFGTASTSFAGTVATVGVLATDTPNDVAYRTYYLLATSGIGIAGSSLLGNGTMQIVVSTTGTVADAVAAGTAVAGTLAAGSYGYLVVYNWTDRNNQIYRSATSVPVIGTASATSATSIVVLAPPITDKPANSVIVELYRTAINASEYQLFASGTMQTSGSVSRVAFQDSGSDTTNSTASIVYTNGGVLDNFNIGACTSVSFFKERLIATPTDDSLAAYYSKSLVPGEPVNFTAEEFFRVDADPGSIVTTAQMDDKECVFKDKKIYVLSGDGANDLGQNSTFSPPQLIASDVGAISPNSVILYPNGLLFKSDKGIYQLDRSLGVQYIGAPVEQYNSNLLSGAVLMDDSTEIRFTLSDSATALVYNYFFGRWDAFSNYMADSACIWQNKLVLASNSGSVSVESSNYYDLNSAGGTASYSLYIETSWLKLKGIQDFQRIMQLMLLGEWLSSHMLTVNLSYDYDSSSSDTFTFDATTRPTKAYQFRVFPKVQKCESIKIKITEISGTGTQQSLVVNELGASVALKNGLMKLPAGKTAI